MRKQNYAHNTRPYLFDEHIIAQCLEKRKYEAAEQSHNILFPSSPCDNI